MKKVKHTGLAKLFNPDSGQSQKCISDFNKWLVEIGSCLFFCAFFIPLKGQENTLVAILKEVPLRNIDSFNVEMLVVTPALDILSLPVFQIDFTDEMGLLRSEVRIFQKLDLEGENVGLITIGHGKYLPNFQLMILSKLYKLISFKELAGAFVDAGTADIKTAKFLSESKFIIYEKDFGERPIDATCGCKESIFQFEKTGLIKLTSEKNYSIPCE